MTLYRMNVQDFDNSGVNTRQVRRQRERLKAKNERRKALSDRNRYFRGDAVKPKGYRLTRSKYMPHIGAKQRAKAASHG